jgi:hypothetical protein
MQPERAFPLFCRSEHAPGGAPTMVVNDDVGILDARVIVNVFRERARSYRDLWRTRDL